MDEEKLKKRIRQLASRLTTCIENKKKETNKKATQAVQAKEMGFNTASNLSKYRMKDDTDAEPSVMGVDKLICIADYYGVSADYLLGFTDDKNAIRKSGHNLVREICDYTGLTREAVEALHHYKDDSLFKVSVSHLLESKKFLENIVDYLSSSLYDDIAEDERYNRLPGTEGTAEEKSKPYYYDIIGSLPKLREYFHQAITATEYVRKEYVSKMAMKCIDHEKVFRELYPYAPYREDLSPAECFKLDEENMFASIYGDPPSGSALECGYDESEQTVSSEEATKLKDFFAEQDIYENQCKAFMEEYYSHRTG